MEWCIDLRVPGAASAATAAIEAHLTRHAELPEVVEIAMPLVSDTLETDDGSPLRWLSIDWDRAMARLAVAALDPAGPWSGAGADGPGLRPIADGVALAHRAVLDLRDAAVSGPVFVELPIVRAPEADLDPIASRPARDDRTLAEAALALFADDDTGDYSSEEKAALMGATAAARLLRAGDAPTTAADAAAAFVALEQEAGADFFVTEISPERLVLGNHRCPFGGAAADAPALCRVTSAMAGRLVADTIGRDVSVSLPERLALGDEMCRLVVDLTPVDDPVVHTYRVPPAGLRPRSQSDADFTEGLQVVLSLRLPRDELSVPLVRRLTRHALEEVGVVDEDRGDVELALSEAAGNVMDHAGPGDVYDVNVEINPDGCEIRVVDVGRGFDHAHLDGAMAEATAEEGRGIALMHALMDQVRFSSHPESGTIVHLVKSLRFDDDAPARALMLDALRRRGRG